MSNNTAKRLIPFSPPDISELEIAEVAATLRSGWITTRQRPDGMVVVARRKLSVMIRPTASRRDLA